MSSSIRDPTEGEAAASPSLAPPSLSECLRPTVPWVFFVFLSNRSDTLPLATKYNIKCVGLSPDGRLAIIVDEGNRCWCGQALGRLCTLWAVVKFSFIARVQGVHVPGLSGALRGGSGGQSDTLASCRGCCSASQLGVQVGAPSLPLQGFCAQRLLLP